MRRDGTSGGRRLLSRVVRALVAASALSTAVALSAEGPPSPVPASRFTDPADGWFDVSNFLDTAYGFVPVLAPITEPAIGYGAVGALVFIDRHVAGAGQRYTRPNLAVVGGLATENGTRGLFASHLGTWRDGGVRTIAALAQMDVNLDFFGLGGDRRPDALALGYTVSAKGGVVGGNLRLAESPLWLGLRYTAVRTNVSFADPVAGLPTIPNPDRDQDLAGLTPSVTYDARDNFFTPTRGWYVDLSVPVFRRGLGGDRDFQTANLTAIGYQPLGRETYFSARATAKASSDGTPFYLRPYVGLRGVQALRYQGEQAAEFEAELRWQLHSRFSLIGFGGAGVAKSDQLGVGREKSVAAGGAGFRYLIARKHGLHMGLDVAAGPDKPVFYVVFGNAWLRP